MASIACSPFLSMPRDRAQVTRTGSPFFPRPQLNLVGASPASRLQTKNGSWAPTARLRSRVLCSRQNEPAVVTGDLWEKLILNSEIPVLVEFYASWCGPCRMVHRVIDEIAIDYAGRLKCFVLNTDNDFRVAEEYDIKAVPVVLLFSNGEKRDAVIGTMPKDFYVASIDKVLRP